MKRVPGILLLAMLMTSLVGTAPGGNQSLAQEASTGSIRLTLISCGQTAMSQSDDFAGTCTDTIDAQPPAYAISSFSHGEKRAISIPDAPRDDEGAYLIEDVAAGAVSLVGLEPGRHEAFTTVPAQSTATGAGILVPVDAGQTVDFAVYYYNPVADEIPPAANLDPNFFLTVRACPDGVDPQMEANRTECTIDTDLPPIARLTAPPDLISYAVSWDRRADGTYFTNVPSEVGALSGLNHDLYGAFVVDDGGTGGLVETEPGVLSIALPASGQVEATLYYYNPTGDTPVTPEAAETARVTLKLLGCPTGIDPRQVDPAAECLEPISATGATMHSGATDSTYTLEELEESPGVYVADVAVTADGSQVTFSGLEASAYDDNVIVGATARTSHGEFHVDVQPGDDITVSVYFYHYD